MKREIRQVFQSRTIWTWVFAAGITLGVAAPFGTQEVTRALPRIAYWQGIAILTFFSGTILSRLLLPVLRARSGNRWLATGTSALVIGAVVSIEILSLNWAVLGRIMRWSCRSTRWRFLWS